MIILENSITATHLRQMKQFVVTDAVLSDDGVSVGRGLRRIDHLEDDEYTTYCATVNDELVGWLCLKQIPRFKVKEVWQVWMDPEHRGRGLTTRLYDAAIVRDGIFLASGCTHTSASRALWASFVRDDRYTIWAHNLRDTARYCPVWYDDVTGEIECELPLYRNSRRTDVRLLALRK